MVFLHSLRKAMQAIAIVVSATLILWALARVVVTLCGATCTLYGWSTVDSDMRATGIDGPHAATRKAGVMRGVIGANPSVKHDVSSPLT